MGKSLVEHFAAIEDPRKGRVAHDLVEILVIVTCGVLAKQESFVEIADWARIKQAWFRRFLRLANGIPSHDTMISLRVENGQARRIEARYYTSSAELDADEFAAAVRRHWAVENDLHWRLDVTLREDACAVRRDHAPENLAIVRRIVLNLLKLDTAHPKLSVRRRCGLAAWDDDERARVFGVAIL